MSEFVPFGKRPSAPKLVPEGAKVEAFQVRDLRHGNAPSYQAIRATFDAGIASKGQRFALSEHVANQLSVEQEDLLRFERRVQEKLDERLGALREETLAKAYAEGLEKGRSEAYESEKANLVRQVELMGAAVGSIAKAKELLAGQYEKALLEISFRLARIVVNHEVEHRPEAITHTLIDVLQRISKEDDVMIHLASDEFEAIDKIQSEIREIARSGRISFQMDQRLERGSCVVESLSGEIKATIEERFRKLEEEILGAPAPYAQAEGA